MYTAWLMFGDWFKDVYFPDQSNWNRKVVLRQDETGVEYDMYLSVRSLEDRVWVAPIVPLSWKDGSRREHEVKGETVFTMCDLKSGHEIRLIIKPFEKQWLRFTKYCLPRKKLVIGRDERADIRDTGALMTGQHGYLGMTQDGYVRYQDQSSNGTYLNGRKMRGSTARLSFGDVLAFPTGLKIIYLGQCIAVNRTTGSRDCSLEKWRHKESQALERTDCDLPSIYEEYQRTPRMLTPCEVKDVEIEAPLAKQVQPQQPLFLQIGPSMTMVLPMMMGTLVASSGNGMLSSGVVMIGTSSVLAVIWGLVNRRCRKKNDEELEHNRVGMYQRYIAEMESELKDMNEREYRRLIDTYPNAAQCAALPGANSHKLWDRMPLHADFLHVRVGTGSVEMPCTIEVPTEKLSLIDDALRQEPERLKNTYATVNNAPVTIPLRNEAVIGILGGMRAVLFAQGLLMQIAALHSYHDVRIAVLTDESSVSQWNWARWLPHVFTSEDRELRMVAFTPSDVHDVVSYLEEVLTIRKNNASERISQDNEAEGGKDAPPLPHYVIFCTNYSILEDELIIRQLLTNRHGMTLVMLGKDMTGLPKECRVVLNVEGGKGHIHYSEGTNREVDFEYPDRSLVKTFSREMAPLRVQDVAENAAIPTLVSFLDIYGVRRTEDLEVWRMWTENHTYEGLRSVIGYRAGSQPFVLDISDRFHGPHGLIAGTTGSGKSVMLEPYILSLALNYSPRQVQFILIDYKGGGMADSFRELPHVAGIIDNLQGPRVIDRALASLNGEIHRRERIFKEVQINNINDYTRQYGDTPGREMPHLVIIVDEFAELKSEQPEFMGELVSASRVGRSLGIHLILATQKPSNSVSDEIWANSRFHLCLRVQTRQDSMEMLKRPDAAYIKGMGRCFIQIGNDEEFHQVQTSYSGLDYRPDEPRAEEMPHLLNSVGHEVNAAGKVTGKKEKVPSQMDAVLERIYEVAREHDMSSSRQLWLPELPRQIYLRDIDYFKRALYDGVTYPNPIGSIVIPLGMADDVANQRYMPFTVDLTQIRNLIVAGLAGTGKTTLVQSMVYSLCSLYDPERLNIYILSLTSQTLRNLSAFPQVGDLAFDGETLEIKRFLNMLTAEMVRRANLFAAASTDSFVEYNTARIKRGEKPEPAIVIVVDRFAQLREMFASDDYYMGRIQTLLQEGSGRGIHFIVTAMTKSEIPMKLHPCFGGITLQMKEKGDYSECLGRSIPYGMPPIANITGRGMGVLGGKVYEVQYAMGGAAPEHLGEGYAPLQNAAEAPVVRAMEAGEALTDVERAEQIAAYAKAQDDAWQGARPSEIPRLPKDPTWETMFKAQEYKKLQKEPFLLPVGYDMVRGTLATVKTERAPSWMVYGPKRSGVTNFLKLMARVMADRGADVHIIAGTHWSKLAGELGAKLYTTPESVISFLSAFPADYARSRKPLRDAALEKSKAAAARQAAAFKPCCILVDNAERLYADFSQEPYKASQMQMAGLLGEIVEKPYYNFTVIMGVSAGEKTACSNDPLKRLAAQGRAVALGGRVNEFDPCGVGAALGFKAASAALPLGQGYLGANGAVTQIVVPLAERDDEEE